MNQIKLTQYSHGAGCGCKISPAILDKILHTTNPKPTNAKLLVGNDTRDDAAVYAIDDKQALISTTDFFMPIVDDAFDFGRIAAANAISDVYAMGGKPILAIAILGWPIDKLAPEVAKEVLEGARAICLEAGIILAGGHSIDCPEPVFGLAVNGLVDIKNLKQNSTATDGCLLYLTKPLGVGILTTAQKKGILKVDHQNIAPTSMAKLNKIGSILGEQPYISAMTDVTGFGLLGHLTEMCEGSGLQAKLYFDEVPIIPEAKEYLAQGAIPGGTNRNWSSYGEKIGQLTEYQKQILADPQTSGGLLVAIEPIYQKEFEALLHQSGIPIDCCRTFGRLEKKQGAKTIEIQSSAGATL
jgi:selenide, water dikinase